VALRLRAAKGRFSKYNPVSTGLGADIVEPVSALPDFLLFWGDCGIKPPNKSLPLKHIVVRNATAMMSYWRGIPGYYPNLFMDKQ
jgi:hypothetical protein